MWVHARRWRVGDPAGSAGGRLGAQGSRSYDSFYASFCAPVSDFIYTNFSGGRCLDFIYTNVRGFCRKKALRFLRNVLRNFKKND